MSLLTPIYDKDGGYAAFLPDRYDTSKAVQLIQPATRNNMRVGIHPVTGQVYPATLIGALAPNVGDPANGMVVAANHLQSQRLCSDNDELQRVGAA